MMTLKECAALAGAPSYPEYFNALYDEMCADGSIDSTELFSEEYIRAVNDRYGLLKTNLDIVLEAAKEIAANEPLRRYTNLMGRALAKGNAPAFQLPWPETPTLGTDFAGFIAMLPAMDIPSKNMDAHNLPKVYRDDVFSQFEKCIDIHTMRFGRPALNQLYFGWLGRYLVPDIFSFGGFNMQQINSLAPYVVMLRNKNTGELEVVMYNSVMHRDGMVLGSAGFEDEAGSYTAKFEEFDDRYEGYPCARSGFCTGVKQTYPKSDWEIAIRPGDSVISVHIPRGAKLSGNALPDAIEESLKFYDEYFPEFKPKAVYCASWLMDTRIDEICGGAPNIVNFQRDFHAFPIRSAGKEIFSFVFIHPFEKLEDLPEDTRLMRALKKRYLEGGFIHAFGAIYPIER